jgi:uncharacterized protein (TIGR00369 family)
MSEQDTIARINTNAPPFLDLLGGRMTAFDAQAKTATMYYEIGTAMCHSIDVVQGGFVTAMLDAAMSHTVFGMDESIVGVSSLEIKTSFLEPTRAGQLRAVASVMKWGHKLVFLESRLYDTQGLLTATASSVGKLQRR